jgi:hypothetical protein
MDGSGTQRSFTTELRDAVRARDCLALAAVPVLVAAVFLLPAATRRALAFAYHDPTAVSAFTAHFVHFRVEHLAANVLGYVLLAGFGYVLAALAGYRRLFAAAAVTFLVAFPPVLSGLNLAVPRRAIGYGLSGVNMAFAGLLGVVVVAYASQRLDHRVRVRHAPGVFFGALAIVAVVALPSDTVTLVLAAAGVVVASAYLVSAARAWRTRPRRRSHRGSSSLGGLSSGWLDGGLLGSVLFFGYPFVGFPARGAVDGTQVNLYVHLLGFCLGFIVPYVAISMGLFDAETAATDSGGGTGDSTR